MLFEPVGAALGNGLDCGFECVRVVVFVFGLFYVVQEGWSVGDRVFMHGWWGLLMFRMGVGGSVSASWIALV